MPFRHSLFVQPRSVLAVVLACIFSLAQAEISHQHRAVIYTAKKIITMDPDQTEAKAVAVAGGRIVGVGTQQSLSSLSSQIDTRFEEKIIMPGFIDPHVHPSLPAVLTQLPFIAPDDWYLPTAYFPSATSPKAYLARLQQLVTEHNNPQQPFITWGYHPLWHGELFREQLSQLFPDQAVILWHRSFHEIIVNDAALDLLGISKHKLGESEQVDWHRGHFFENGMMQIFPYLSHLLAPANYAKGLTNFIDMAHQGGVTSVMDMGIGVFGNPSAEISMIRSLIENQAVPLRVVLTPIISDFLARDRSIEQAFEEITQWRDGNSSKVLIGNHFKIMLDGAIYSGLAQFSEPGYLDGHKGVWMNPLEVTERWAQAFWNRGYQIHAHTNGDASAQALIQILQNLQKNYPRQDHRLTLEHFAYSTEAQNKQLKELGVAVSANPYYHFILSDIYSDQWLGPERGNSMVRLGSLERLGVPFALHSDSPMAPLKPLTLVSAAVNRITINGHLTGANERISLTAALQAITINAAWIMGWEKQIGSITVGKRADFTILEQDPYNFDLSEIKDIPIWGTVFEGQLRPLINNKAP